MAIDPGWTTGLAFRIDGKLHTTTSSHHPEVLDYIKGVDQVVIERFQTGGRLSTPGLETIELVGAVKGYCHALNKPCEIAMPTQRYSHMKAAESMVGTVITPSEVSKHEVDALAHLLAFEHRNGPR